VFGDDSDNWAGKRIVIYADPTRDVQGEQVGGLRVRIPTAKKTTGDACRAAS